MVEPVEIVQPVLHSIIRRRLKLQQTLGLIIRQRRWLLGYIEAPQDPISIQHIPIKKILRYLYSLVIYRDLRVIEELQYTTLQIRNLRIVLGLRSI